MSKISYRQEENLKKICEYFAASISHQVLRPNAHIKLYHCQYSCHAGGRFAVFRIILNRWLRHAVVAAFWCTEDKLLQSSAILTFSRFIWISIVRMSRKKIVLKMKNAFLLENLKIFLKRIGSSENCSNIFVEFSILMAETHSKNALVVFMKT